MRDKRGRCPRFVRSPLPASRRQQAPADGEPNANAASRRPGNSSTGLSRGKAEGGGLAGRECHAVHGDPARARQCLHAGVVAAAAGATDGNDGVGILHRERGRELAAAIGELRNRTTAHHIAPDQAAMLSMTWSSRSGKTTMRGARS